MHVTSIINTRNGGGRLFYYEFAVIQIGNVSFKTQSVNMHKEFKTKFLEG